MSKYRAINEGSLEEERKSRGRRAGGAGEKRNSGENTREKVVKSRPSERISQKHGEDLRMDLFTTMKK